MMLIIEIPKENKELVERVKTEFPNCEVVDINSLDAETISQIIIPSIQIALPVVSTIIVALINTSKKVKVKWGNIEISGNEKQVEKFLEKIMIIETKQSEMDSKKGQNK